MALYSVTAIKHYTGYSAMKTNAFRPSPDETRRHLRATSEPTRKNLRAHSGTPLRPAAAGDVEAIAALWHRGWGEAHLGHVPEGLVAHRRLADFRVRVPERIAATTVATCESQVVGFLTVHDDEIEQLYVDASARGGVVAGALLAHCETAIAARHDTAWLAVAAGNARARRFYERQGWREAGAFDYAAQVSGGTFPVPCLRYEKRVTRATSPE
jgi:GNAT superfamily N-acetyltransferase